MEKKDKIVLGLGCEYRVGEGGLNGNELIIGSTGSGKTMSISEPRILYSYEQSLVIPITKRELFNRYAPLLESRGYEVWDLNLAQPAISPMGYDPCRAVHSDLDVMNLAEVLVGGMSRYFGDGNADPYWSESTTSCLAAILGLTKHETKYNEKEFRFSDFLCNFNAMEITYKNGNFSSTLDRAFDFMAFDDEHAQAPRLWKTITGLSNRTASCIISMMNSAIDKFATTEVEAIFKNPVQIDIKELGKRKVALFITTSPVNASLKKLATILYSDIFKELFEEAQANGGSLTNRVHIIADDFACGSRIPRFDEYISVFRAAGISVSILLQSKSQLTTLYNLYAAHTIADNCDTIVFMGSLDIETCREISTRTGYSLEEILNMPIGKEIVVRRGESPIITERYPIFEDEIYKKEVLERG